MICRTLAEVVAAAHEAGRDDPPLSQQQADLAAVLFAPRKVQRAA